MTQTSYQHFLDIVDDSVAIATEAVKQAEAASGQVVAPEITLIKVASERCDNTAELLIETGVFSRDEKAELVNVLRDTDLRGHKILEKMASRAVFTMGSEDLGGTLVEKTSINGRGGSSSLPTAVSQWRAALDEAEAELNGH